MHADPNCQNCLSDRDIALKTTQPFCKNSYEASFWKSGFRLLFSRREAIEIWAYTHCQNCLSGKNIMLKTTQPFFKSYCELHLTL